MDLNAVTYKAQIELITHVSKGNYLCLNANQDCLIRVGILKKCLELLKGLFGFTNHTDSTLVNRHIVQLLNEGVDHNDKDTVEWLQTYHNPDLGVKEVVERVKQAASQFLNANKKKRGSEQEIATAASKVALLVKICDKLQRYDFSSLTAEHYENVVKNTQVLKEEYDTLLLLGKTTNNHLSTYDNELANYQKACLMLGKYPEVFNLEGPYKKVSDIKEKEPLVPFIIHFIKACTYYDFSDNKVRHSRFDFALSLLELSLLECKEEQSKKSLQSLRLEVFYAKCKYLKDAMTRKLTVPVANIGGFEKPTGRIKGVAKGSETKSNFSDECVVKEMDLCTTLDKAYHVDFEHYDPLLIDLVKWKIKCVDSLVFKMLRDHKKLREQFLTIRSEKNEKLEGTYLDALKRMIDNNEEAKTNSVLKELVNSQIH